MGTLHASRRQATQIRRYPARRPRDPRWWRRPLAVVLVLLGVFVTGAGLGRSASGPWDFAAGSGVDLPRAGSDREAMAASPPVRLAIPAIKVMAPVTRVGLAEDGSIAVPPLERHQETGWYEGGPAPGADGPAVIVGHSDTRSGPSVFYALRKLRPGDRIEVTRADRSVAVFEVSSVEQFGKDNLPGERVYDDYRQPGLRLITCGGRFVGGGIGYADNIIAFATLVGSRAP